MIMKHEPFVEQISLWLDNELSPAELSKLQTHLADCPACRQTAEALQRVDRLIRSQAAVMVAPNSDFAPRFEARLVRHQPIKPWQLWLTLIALFSGTLFLFGAWAILSGITLVSVSTSVLEAAVFHQWLTAFIESVESLRVLLNLGGLFLKVSLITMGQPIFWISTLIAIGLIWLWVRIVEAVSKHSTPTINLVF
jgi:hypothetical protein